MVDWRNMGFFSSILKAGIQVKNEEKELIDVTSIVIKNIPSDNFENIRIESDLDLQISFTQEDAVFRVFTEKKTDADKIQFDYKYENKQLIIKIISDNNLKGGILCVAIPKVALGCFYTRHTDISVERAEAKILKIITRSGDVRVTIEDSEEVLISTKSGDIFAKIKKGMYKIETNSKSGDVMMQNIKPKEKSQKKLNCSSQSGDILIQSLKE